MKKPDHDTIISTYHQEVARGGTAGALKRAAARLGVSDETVRRARIREEQQPEPDDLLYTPPPGGYPEPVPLCQKRCHKARHTSPLLRHNRRVRAVPRGAPRHSVSAAVAPHIATGDLLYLPPAAPVRLSPDYEQRLRAVNRFEQYTPRIRTYHEPRNWRPLLWLAALLLIPVLFAGTNVSRALAHQPLSATFVQQR